MNPNISRLRMFAGPNGSGKSTIKAEISDELLGIYINPDEIEKEIKQLDFLDLRQYEIESNEKEVALFFQKSSLLKKSDLLEEADYIRYSDNKIIFHDVSVNSYFAAVCADFIRKKLLEYRKTFTFETVMSSYDKIELLKLAKSLGYRTYLYYVATNDPIINISRVRNRVRLGGHDVPEDKIISRYIRSLDNLMDAVELTNRAYIFDNSGPELQFICEITDGEEIEIKQESIPNWFYSSVIQKSIKEI